MKLNRGFLLAVEGIDGCGKDTVCDLLVKIFAENNIDAVSFADLSSTNLGLQVREIFLGEGEKPTVEAEILLINAARSQNFTANILPALGAGNVVIQNRGVDSTKVYQHFVKGGDYGVIAAVNLAVCGDVKAQQTILVNTSLEVAAQRMEGSRKKDYHESLGPEFHGAVQQGFARIWQDSFTTYSVIPNDDGLVELENRLRAFVGTMVRMFAQGGLLTKEYLDDLLNRGKDKLAEVAATTTAGNENVDTTAPAANDIPVVEAEEVEFSDIEGKDTLPWNASEAEDAAVVE